MQIVILTLLNIITHISTYLFGKIDFLFTSTIILFGINYILLFFKDYKEKKIILRTLILRLFKIIGYITFVIIAVIIDKLLKINETTRNIVLMTLLYNEIICILKTTSYLGLKTPTILVNTLQKTLDSLPKEVIPPSEKEKNEL